MFESRENPSISSRKKAKKKAAERPKRVPRNGSAERMLDILGTTYDLISERGIAGINMRMVGEATGMSTGSINYYFKNKRGLIIAALQAAYRLPDDWDQYKGSPRAQLRRLAMGYAMKSPKDRFWRFWIDYTAHSVRDEEMRLHQQRRYKIQEKFWCRLIRDGIKTGEFRKSLNPEAAARSLLVSAHGVLVRQLVLNDAASREFAKQEIDQALKLLDT
jgi:AcrR family transcriptional regulator